jgi:hypothetical protein
MTDWPTAGLTSVLVLITAYYAWQNKRIGRPEYEDGPGAPEATGGDGGPATRDADGAALRDLVLRVVVCPDCGSRLEVRKVGGDQCL